MDTKVVQHAAEPLVLIVAQKDDLPKSLAEKLKQFLKKYFWEGQKLSHEVSMKSVTPILSKWESKILKEHRRAIGVLVPLVIGHLFWWSMAVKHNFFARYADAWPMAVTMLFGSLVAGATSEGGGAVAFPVMTLILGIEPNVARDFALGIQSGGMTAAAFTILWMNIHIEWHSVIWCGAGSTVGLILGLEYLAPILQPDWKKMAFVGISTSFAVALFILNREKKRQTYDWVQNLSWWRILVLIFTGFIGGFFTAFLGSGSDLCSFVTLTLLFLVSEKVATPTSVVLMAFMSIVGLFWRVCIQGNYSPEATMYVSICFPIVIFGAPMGSMISSHFHRQVLATAIYVLELVSFITGFAVVKPSVALTAVTLAVLAGGSGLFWLMSLLGKRIHGLSKGGCFGKLLKRKGNVSKIAVAHSDEPQAKDNVKNIATIPA